MRCAGESKSISKEAKQHLGFLQEQTTTFASHTASLHLCAIRYLMLVHNKLEDPDFRVGDIRSQIQEQLDSVSFAGKLWQIFRAIISGTLSELQATLGCSVDTVMLAIDKRVSEFFISSLQLDAFTMQFGVRVMGNLEQIYTILNSET
ncbi:MAG: hypothetical protein KZQ63_16065 [Candidatus Thiodiazotropha sp. (ex Lucinoma aequizonata)]|nr:hypothetical protein [Candidatus Thiodiazotropha sp. (ex Lucinoma aequizonata)]MCU7913365.1 hypothetical protein [Candidatus Thiodiazotropha sp. (ex Lucinoma aequizonata)]